MWYQHNLLHGLVRPIQNWWESILQKVSFLLSNQTCRVRRFMSLIGLLMATEKQVPLGRLHMRPIQWHLKRYWSKSLGSGHSNSLLGLYAFLPVSLLGKVISKLSDQLYRRVILIAPGWPNMPWFGDLMDLYSQILFCLPNHPDLVTPPFNGAHHRDLASLNFLLEPMQSRN